MDNHSISIWTSEHARCEQAVVLHWDSCVAKSIALLLNVRGLPAQVAYDYADALERASGRQSAFLIDVGLNVYEPRSVPMAIKAGLKERSRLVIALMSPRANYTQDQLIALHYDGACGLNIDYRELALTLKNDVGLAREPII